MHVVEYHLYMKLLEKRYSKFSSIRKIFLIQIRVKSLNK